MLKQLFYDMLRIRLIEEAIVAHYPEQEMRCPVHLSIGQEAVAVGVCSQLNINDRVMSGHRAHAHYLAKGGNLKKMIAEIYGKETGCCSGKGGSMHLVDLPSGFYGSTPIVGGTFPVAIGHAFAAKLKKQSFVTAVFFGEGMTEEGVFCEGLNFATLHDLPILFICENNLYSVYSPLKVRQSKKRNLLQIAKGHGLAADKGNGNDLEEVVSLSKKAIAYIQEGAGPYLLEFDTYRYREHCGPSYDNHIGYRTESEFLKWKVKCPVQSLQEKLIKKKFIDENELNQMNESIYHEIKEAFKFAKDSPFPKMQNFEEQVYL